MGIVCLRICLCTFAVIGYVGTRPQPPGLSTAVAIWGWLRGTRARVLLYHSISDDPGDPLSVPPQQFAAQMDWLASNGWRVISCAELVDWEG